MQSVCSYAREASAERIRMSSTREYVWARLQGKECHDLLFRLPSMN